MYDTDMTGVIYFASIFRFVNNAWEDFVDEEASLFKNLSNNKEFSLVMAHVEADLLYPIRFRDLMKTQIFVENIGTSSFKNHYEIYNQHSIKVAKGNTVHVSINKTTRKSAPMPEGLQTMLKKYTTP